MSLKKLAMPFLLAGSLAATEVSAEVQKEFEPMDIAESLFKAQTPSGQCIVELHVSLSSKEKDPVKYAEHIGRMANALLDDDTEDLSYIEAGKIVGAELAGRTADMCSDSTTDLQRTLPFAVAYKSVLSRLSKMNAAFKGAEFKVNVTKREDVFEDPSPLPVRGLNIA